MNLGIKPSQLLRLVNILFSSKHSVFTFTHFSLLLSILYCLTEKPLLLHCSRIMQMVFSAALNHHFHENKQRFTSASVSTFEFRDQLTDGTSAQVPGFFPSVKLVCH